MAQPNYLDDPILCDLFAYWDRLRGERVAPSYAEVDPLDMPARILPYLLIAEVVPDEPARRYRFRLCGTEIEGVYGGGMGGRHVDELGKGAYRDYMQGLYDKLVASRRPVYSVGSYHGRTVWTKRLMLPLSADANAIDVVLSGQTFFFQTTAAQDLDPLAGEAREEFLTHL